MRERDLIEDARRKGWVANLLPHEYIHSWCGKFRRPAGMCTPDFHTPMKTRLLWVYEGLAEYLGEVLMVRSGLLDLTEFRERLGFDNSLALSPRRPALAIARRHWCRFLCPGASSPNWSGLRRDQDYYFEGMLVWLEADAIIRERTKGKKSLDDFCRKFLGGNPTTAKVSPYELPEIVKDLQELTELDWESFLLKRVAQPLDELPLEVVSRCGYKIQYSDQLPREQMSRQNRDAGGVSALDSIGMSFGGDGTVTEIMRGGIGDRAGFAHGMKVIGVNNKTFSRQRLLDALAESVNRHKIEFLLIEGEDFRTLVLEYSGGPRYLEIVRDPTKPDLLAEILKPAADRTKSAPDTRPEANSSLVSPPKRYVCLQDRVPDSNRRPT